MTNHKAPSPKPTVADWAKACWSEHPPHAKLFVHDDQHGKLNASLHLHDAGYGYARGFHIAGQLVCDWMIKSRWDLDVLLFPLIYLYRHHVELMLKRLILKGARLQNMRLSPHDRACLLKHRLDKLLEILLPIIKAVAPVPTQTERGIRAYVSQLNLSDPEGQASRYHTSSRGSTSLAQLSHVNVRVFAEGMEWLSCCLEGIDCRFDDKDELMKVQPEGRSIAG